MDLPTAVLSPALDFYKRNVKIILLTLAVLVVAFLVFQIVRSLRKPANASYIPGAPVPSGWEPTAVTDGLFENIDGTFVSSEVKDDNYKAFNDLNDNQMIDVYNDW